MFKVFLTVLCLLIGYSNSNAQLNYVKRDSAVTILSGTDIDTVIFLLPAAYNPRDIMADTTLAGVTAYRPTESANSDGYFNLWLNRTNVSGTADSFRVFGFQVEPYSGALAKNDSFPIVGTASTFANIVSGSVYSISIPAGFGLALKIWQGDLVVTDTTRIRPTFVYTQE